MPRMLGNWIFNENGFDNVVLSLKISNDAIEYILPDQRAKVAHISFGSMKKVV